MSTFFTHATPQVIVAAGREGLFRRLGIAIDGCLALALVVIPLFFLPASGDVIEHSKQTLLIVLTGVAGAAALGRMALAGRVRFVWNMFHVIVLAYVAAVAFSTFFSVDPFLSFFGAPGQTAPSFLTTAMLAAWYFIIVSRVRTVSQLYNLVFLFLFSSLLVALYGILQALGLHLFGAPVTQSKAFTTVGSIYGLAAYLTVPLTIAAAVSLHGCQNRVCLLGQETALGRSARLLVWGTFLACFSLLLLVDYWPAWLAMMVGLVAVLGLGYFRSRRAGHPLHLMVAGLMGAIGLVLVFAHSPLQLRLPTEVAPSARASFQIARDVLQDRPLLGSGPATWGFDYASHRAALVNQSPFWNIRFDRSVSAFVTLLATHGIVGVLFWLLFIGGVLSVVGWQLLRERDDDVWYGVAMVLGGFVSSATIFLTAHAYLSHLLVFWFLAGFLVAGAQTREWVWRPQGGVRKFGGILLSAGFVSIFILFWITGQRFAADRLFTKAIRVSQEKQKLSDAITYMERARSLTPWNDQYQRSLSQLYLRRIAEILAGATSPDAIGTRVQPDITKAVAASQKATALSKLNVENWINQGAVYGAISGFTKGADTFAISAYQKALEREPMNPAIWSDMGGVYLMRAEASRTLLASQNAKAREEAQSAVLAALREAEVSLRRAVELKPDYLPARYRLGAAYERQGKLASSIVELEKILAVQRQDVGVAFELSLLYYRNREPDRALALMEQVVKAQPKNPNARWYLSALYEDRGRLDDAWAQMQPLAEDFADHTTVQERIKYLQDARGKRGATGLKVLPEPIKERMAPQG